MGFKQKGSGNHTTWCINSIGAVQLSDPTIADSTDGGIRREQNHIKVFLMWVSFLFINRGDEVIWKTCFQGSFVDLNTSRVTDRHILKMAISIIYHKSSDLDFWFRSNLMIRIDLWGTEGTDVWIRVSNQDSDEPSCFFVLPGSEISVLIPLENWQVSKKNNFII